ncbi:NAD(P)-dependent oxidoreductase [Sphingomonas sp.]|uniref:NAD(P)-dependent oxidoreductase n=1 Tax=Sphingomonas sp. TaxID=28214 RepID=UPI002D803D3B|nr:DUF1932 domain-containing protein [Sphingomonas sp.]HEU0045426.1 DUF1932 domain-containing protein [Sphingomonas sp.]
METAAFIGFGEAASAFAGAAGWRGPARAFDLKLIEPGTRDAIVAAAAAARVAVVGSGAEAVAGAALVLSLVTADQALAAAVATAPHLAPGALYCDMNSVAPDTKRQAAALIEGAGGAYVDVAVMAPVHPSQLAVPLLVAGPHAPRAVDELSARGFSAVRALNGPVGTASAIKMIRSVVVKGIEALTAECLLAADAAGVLGEVLASLDASERAMPWDARADYNLDRMMAHGRRRADEMDEVVKTLDALGTGTAMARGTADRQRAIGALRLSPPPGLDAKLAALRALPRLRDAA